MEINGFLNRTMPEPNTGCWLWTGSRTVGGYGTIYVGGYKSIYAHRFSYEHHKGPIPEGLQLDHLCRVRHCVNPDHLEAVTNRENAIRGIGAASRVHDKKCHRGHERWGRHQDGGRYCLECYRLRNIRIRNLSRQRAYKPRPQTMVVPNADND